MKLTGYYGKASLGEITAQKLSLKVKLPIVSFFLEVYVEQNSFDSFGFF